MPGWQASFISVADAGSLRVFFRKAFLHVRSDSDRPPQGVTILENSVIETSASTRE